MKEEYYLTYNSGCGVSAYTGDMKTPFYTEAPAIKFSSIKEASEVMHKIITLYGLNRAARKHFNIILTSEAQHVVNAK